MRHVKGRGRARFYSFMFPNVANCTPRIFHPFFYNPSRDEMDGCRELLTFRCVPRCQLDPLFPCAYRGPLDGFGPRVRDTCTRGAILDDPCRNPEDFTCSESVVGAQPSSFFLPLNLRRKADKPRMALWRQMVITSILVLCMIAAGGMPACM